MYNNYPKAVPIQPPSIWTSNPHLKTLLVVLIFVFLFCGVALGVLQVIGQNSRDALYDQVILSMPQHHPAPHIAQSASSTPTAIAGWKTYRDDEFAFEFRYPETWLEPIRNSNWISLGCPDVSFKPTTSCPISVELADGMSKDAVSNYFSLMSKSKTNFTRVTIDQRDAVRVIAKNFVDRSQCPESDDVTYSIMNPTIVINFYDRCSLYEDDGVFRKIISTFKFIK